MPTQLTHFAPWGRSFAEYQRMFALGPGELAGRILGCGDGPAAFNLEATRRGARVVSVDPLYTFSAEDIARRIAEVAPVIIAKARATADSFVWDEFDTPEVLATHRLAVMREFLADYEAGRRSGRYLPAALPRLPFAAGTFDLALSSHLLFTYSRLIDTAGHLAAVAELLRVAARVRIFPLVDMFDGGRSPHLAPVLDWAAAHGYSAEIRRVDYEFQRGGNELVELSRPAGR